MKRIVFRFRPLIRICNKKRPLGESVPGGRCYLLFG
jgi:hypothetical protein